jgi:rhodanese-related sulfurtransferase
MPFDSEKIRANRDHFAAKLLAEKQRNDVLHAVDGSGAYDFVLLDTRGREPFSQAHIPGAWSVTLEELDKVASHLPKDKEIVAYCWSHD